MGYAHQIGEETTLIGSIVSDRRAHLAGASSRWRETSSSTVMDWDAFGGLLITGVQQAESMLCKRCIWQAVTYGPKTCRQRRKK